MAFNWEEFLDPYVQTVGELKIKLRGVRKQYLKKGLYSPIEFVTGRVKRRDSIVKKARMRGYTRDSLSEMEDIAGIRVMVQFVDDVWDVLALLKRRKDFKIIEERDYIHNQKASGYRSYHVVIEYPIDTIDGFQVVNAEIQIRTLAMNFWATIEHSLNYKYGGVIPQEIQERLSNAAKEAAQLDAEMGEIREDIQEAQLMFDSPQARQDVKKEKGEEDELWS
ncbi:GTP pyrophosphokinase [Lactococcus termiticola]|uniref:GTP pyrophosphokinase n=1 Tax=Lactococcus termiticola TaxID=2169526 RepID=A0A2R5HE04_9LACT|nr:GTP pyrophosphokinase family protein [Lactococcus termiticola]GBG96056.1 GTP pyrophosphokinase [Lactococcus termiticola]